MKKQGIFHWMSDPPLNVQPWCFFLDGFPPIGWLPLGGLWLPRYMYLMWLLEYSRRGFKEIIIRHWRVPASRPNPNFLGPRGPLVLPLVECPSVRVQEKSGSQYIQAYMPYESSEVSSNQPDGTKGSHRCPLDPLGPCRPTPWPPETL